MVTAVNNGFQVLSTDTKPVAYTESGNTCYELDTKNGFTFDGNNICPATSTGWWPL